MHRHEIFILIMFRESSDLSSLIVALFIIIANQRLFAGPFAHFFCGKTRSTLKMKLKDLEILEVDSDGKSKLDVGSPKGIVSWSPLHYACAVGDEELVKELLEQPVLDVNEFAQVSRQMFYAPSHTKID